MYKVRFHLAKGVNYQKWQVTDLETKEVYYFDPKSVSLEMKNCKLKNSKTVAQKIYLCLSTKTVCSWIECEYFSPNFLVYRYEDYKEYTDDRYYFVEPIFYNPKKHPNWVDDEGKDIDGTTYKELSTINRQVFICGERTDETTYINKMFNRLK